MTVTFSFQPSDKSHDVDPSASLFITCQTDELFLYPGSVVLTIDGEDAIAGGAFVRPAYGGAITGPGPVVVIEVRPRRRFLYGVKVELAGEINEQTSMSGTLSASFDAVFYTRLRSTQLLDPALRATRVDRPFVDAPALELHRTTALGVLSAHAGSAAVVQLYYRVHASSLRSLTGALEVPPTVRAELPRLRGEDVGLLQECDARLAAIRALWEPALRELLALGVPPPDVQLLLRAGNSDSFQERVAAACAALLMAAARMRRRENPPQFTVVDQTI